MSIFSDFFKKEAPLLGLQGSGGGLGFLAGGGSGHPFDDMSNFPGATRLGDDKIYYSTSGQYTFQDPTGGEATYRFTCVGGGGGSDGDGNGWYGVCGAGGGGCARGEIQTSTTLYIGVGEGGRGVGQYNPSNSQYPQYYNGSIQPSASAGGHSRVYGRGGNSYVRSISHSSNTLVMGTGGNIGMYGYHPTIKSSLDPISSSQGFNFNINNGPGQPYWKNGGYGISNTNGGVTVSNPYIENGGCGGCAAHQQGPTWASEPPSTSPKHDRDRCFATGNSSINYKSTTGESKTYAGAGGGGGSQYNETYENTNVAGSLGGYSNSLATLLSGAGLSFGGGSGSNYGSHGAQATPGNIGGGAGGNGMYNTTSETWQENIRGGDGIVVVEYLG